MRASVSINALGRGLGLALVLLWAAAQAQAEPALKYEIEGLAKELNKNVRGWLGDTPASVAERANFLATVNERTRQSLQAMGYYRPTIVTELDQSETIWVLHLQVSANEPVRLSDIDIELRGEAGDDSAFQELLAAPPFAVGDVLHHGEYDDYKRALKSLGQRRGYFDAKITTSRVAVDVEAGTARMILAYDSGKRYAFGAIQFDETVLDGSLLAVLEPFKQGDPYDLQALQQFQDLLQRTNYFSSVVVRPQLENVQDYQVPLAVNLYPAKRHSFDVGVGYSTETEQRVSLTWRTPRLNRWGHSQETRLEYSAVNPSGRITYRIPLNHPLNDVLQLTVRVEDDEFGDIDSNQKELGVSRETKSQLWINSYSLRRLNESWSVGSVHQDNNYLLPGVSLSYKKRSGKVVDPSSGLSHFLRFETGSEHLGSDIDLLRAYSHVSLVATPAPGHRLVGRAELGAVFLDSGDRSDLAPSLGFFAGGSQSIRGYGYQSLGNETTVELGDGSEEVYVTGGDRLLTGSLEYQYYINDSWRGALFVDAGDAFDEGDFNLNVGAGFGVHYLTAVGAVKFEIANSVSDDDPSWRLHLNIGAEF